MDIKHEARQTRETSAGWYIQRLAARLDTTMAQALDEIGLTLPQLPILMTALEHDGLTQADYANRFRKPPYAISRAIDGLVEAGLLERRPDKNSRRAHNIYVTQAGRTLAPKLFARIADVNAGMLSPLEPAEAQMLLSLLTKTLNAT
ncbi:MAG: MarR family winged helix-turn-helix transcriptional regulator [Pseudomonadota bacterium]